jgi:hypothetical protein
MSDKLRLFNFSIVLAALSGALFFAFPVSERSGSWAHCVLNNWEQYGFDNLGGQLVANPGGHEAIETPQIYGGHKPYVAQAAYFIGSLTGSFHEDGWLFHVLLSLTVGISIWLGFGKTNSATLLAICTIVSPGFIRSTLQLDTLAIPVLLGIPVLFLASKAFLDSRKNWQTIALFFTLLVCYSQINWTTALSLFVIFSYLLASKNSDAKTLFLFFAISALSICFVLVTSLLHKKSCSSSLAESIGFFFNGYLFGAGGYGGIPMDWLTALRRIIIANVIALMPVLIAFLLIAWETALARNFHPSILLPFTASSLCISVLRNYFAAHPWMAASVIILGLIATLKIQLAFQQLKAVKENRGISRIYWASIVLISLIYSFLVIEFLKLNSSTANSILQMIKSQTKRGDLILVDPPSFGGRPVEQWLGNLCDRMIIKDMNLDSAQKNADGRFFVLTTNSTKDGFKEVSKTSDFRIGSSQTFSAVLDLYRKKISRRAECDSPLSEKIYYLYSPVIR